MATIITSDVLAGLAALPPKSVSLLILVPGEYEDILLDDLAEAIYRVLKTRGQAIVARSLPDAFELL